VALFYRAREGRDHSRPTDGARSWTAAAFRYPWAMAPTINTTKLVATAIATFASTDKFIIFPLIMAATPITPRF
jgi:hypothetical protein